MNCSNFRTALTILLSLALVFGCSGCKGHKLEFVEGVSADCLSEGVIAHWHCTDCGANFLDKKAKDKLEDVSIPKLGHNFQLFSSVPATCLEEGKEIMRCVRCGSEQEETIEAKGHFYYTRVTKEPECFKEGECVKICSLCGDSKTEILPPIGHHSFGFDNTCSVCKLKCVPSENLEYRMLIEDGMSVGYAVKGKDLGENLVIPYYYEALPVLEIEESAFQGEEIKKIACFAPVQTIGASAFADCLDLEEIVFPDTLETIGQEAFRACATLEEVSLPQSLKTLGPRAFYACTALRRLAIGKSLKYLGENAFWNCERLEEISVDEENPYYLGVGSCLVEKESAVLLVGAAHSKIPNTVQEIAQNAFLGRIDLVEIEIPKSVQKIGSFAFRDCVNLSRIVYAGNERDWEAVEKGKEWNLYTAENCEIVFLE